MTLSRIEILIHCGLDWDDGERKAINLVRRARRAGFKANRHRASVFLRDRPDEAEAWAREQGFKPSRFERRW